MGAASNTLRLILLGEDKTASKAVKGVGDETDKSTKKMSTFHKVGAAAGVALAGGLVLAGKAAFDMTKRAAEDQQSASRLAQTLHTAAGATDAQVASTEGWITAQGKAYGVTDDDLRPALSKLAVATGSVTKAQKLASLAMDISAGTGKDLQSVSFALAKAQNGNVSGLARLGVQTTKTSGDTMALQKAQTAVKSAQLSYTAAVKAHGKQSAEASIASDKLKQAQENVGAAMEKTKKTTLPLSEITKKLADQYGGAASKNAETAAGKQKILTTEYGELQEQIGAGLLPVMSKLLGIGLKVVNFISKNATLVGTLAAILGTLAAAIWIATTATAAWNAVLALNPLSLIIIGLAALAVGLVIAYKKVGWFRDAVNFAFHAITATVSAVVGFIKDHWAALFVILGGPIGLVTVLIVKNFGKIQAGIQVLGKWATWLWNNAFQPALSFIVKGIGVLLNIWGHMLTALGKVPGFGWATDAGHALENAAGKASSLASAIGKIPTKKSIDVNIYTHHIGKPGTQDPNLPQFAKGGIVTRPTVALVGEAGPEAIVPLTGRHGMGSKSLPSSMAAGGDLGTFTLVVQGPDAREQQRLLLKLKRENGGLALGLA